MSSPPIVDRPITDRTIGDRPLDPAISDALTDLALDLRWSFNHSADRLWEQLDPELWELTHNPWVLLQTVIPGKTAKCYLRSKISKTLG